VFLDIPPDKPEEEKEPAERHSLALHRKVDFLLFRRIFVSPHLCLPKLHD